jgi:hypothetical protein
MKGINLRLVPTQETTYGIGPLKKDVGYGVHVQNVYLKKE